MNFYTIALLAASVLLILCLIVMGILMQKSMGKNPFPPVINPCPDNWVVQGNLCLVPTKDLGSVKSSDYAEFIKSTPGINNAGGNPLDGQSSVDFGDPTWSNSGSSICTKQKWANKYSISWDGISNNSTC